MKPQVTLFFVCLCVVVSTACKTEPVGPVQAQPVYFFSTYFSGFAGRITQLQWVDAAGRVHRAGNQAWNFHLPESAYDPGITWDLAEL
ncbi:MAG: hypothetical protein OHK0039_46190 [Bacteroidia bacterium]